MTVTPTNEAGSDPVPAASPRPATQRSARSRDLREAERSENFPVALRLLPRARRADLQAVYDVVRVIDDLGDDPERAGRERLALLEEFAAELERTFAGQSPSAPVLRALAGAPGFARLTADPFERLVEANRQDQRVASYATIADLRGYCALSAAPIGRIVLALFGAATPQRIAWSDQICAGLQLLEHWQDVAEDRARGRIYLPQEDQRRFGVTDADLDARSTPPALRRLLAFETDRAAGLIDAGLPLVASLTGWARLAVAGFAAGGLATADALAAADYDVLAGPPRPGRADTARHALRLWRGRQP